jgi:CrcB protein
MDAAATPSHLWSVDSTSRRPAGERPPIQPSLVMRDFLLVGAGGFLGAAVRFAVNGLVAPSGSLARLPLATSLVNVTGCLAIGLLAGIGERTELLSPGIRLFLLTGLLGGYTTFSAFALETVSLGREHAWAQATVNVVMQVGVGLVAVLVGHRLATVGAA